jgi:hypothetical protein
MPSLDGKMKVLSEQVLKRRLSDEEELEIYRISDAMGMSNVQSFLYLLLVFKLHEDAMRGQFEALPALEGRLNEKFDKAAELEKKIDETLESSIERILGEGAARIGADMGDTIAERAKDALTASGEYSSLRGQIILVSFMALALTISYWLGAANVFRISKTQGPVETVLFLPAGWCLFISCAMYAYCWGFDNWRLVKRSPYHMAALAALGLGAVVIMSAMFLFG